MQHLFKISFNSVFVVINRIPIYNIKGGYEVFSSWKLSCISISKLGGLDDGVKVSNRGRSSSKGVVCVSSSTGPGGVLPVSNPGTVSGAPTPHFQLFQQKFGYS